MSERRPFLFCFGLGYVAGRLARGLAADGWRVAGTRRNLSEGAPEPNIEAHVHDGTGPLPPGLLLGATHLLISVPPDGEGDPILRHGLPAPESLGHLVWCGYLSTTGVYGDRGGGWVDEETPVAPSTERGARRAAAEAGWRTFAEAVGVPLDIVRIAAIYGPGRNPFEALMAGIAKRIDKPGQVFSRIHVDDLVAVIEAAIAAPSPGRIYNVADDAPAPPGEVVAHAAELLGLPAPPRVAFEDADLSPLARSFYGESKRVSNRRIKRDLGVRLRYPTYREGLAASLRRGD